MNRVKWTVAIAKFLQKRFPELEDADAIDIACAILEMIDND